MKSEFEKPAQSTCDVLNVLEGRIDKLGNHGVRQKVILRSFLKRARSSDGAARQAIVEGIQEALSKEKPINVCHS